MTKKEAADQLAIIVAEMRLSLDASDPDCPTWPDQLLVIADALDPSGFANEPIVPVSRTDTRYRDELAEAQRRLHLILSTIYSTHGYLDGEGEIDTSAKFRAIERLARLDWDDEGVSDVV